MSEEIFSVPDMFADPRLRVFRRLFHAPGEFEEMQVDAYVVITQRYIVFCDSLLCPEDMAVVLASLHSDLPGRKPLALNSHSDWDHCWGNKVFRIAKYFPTPVPIIAHDLCRTRLLSAQAKADLDDYQRRFPLFRNVVLTPPTITLTQPLTIHGGDLTLELFPTPGHGPDHLALWIPELSLLLAFDAAEIPLPLIDDRQQVQPMFATLERFLALQPRHVLCSHGKSTDLTVVENNLAYLREIERRGRRWLLTHQSDQSAYIHDDLAHAPALINYSFEEAVAGADQTIDRTYYNWVHTHNVRCIMQWLMA